MTTWVVLAILAFLVAYLVDLFRAGHWRVLDDPDHFIREERERSEHIRWAQELVRGHRPIRSWTADDLD